MIKCQTVDFYNYSCIVTENDLTNIYPRAPYSIKHEWMWELTPENSVILTEGALHLEGDWKDESPVSMDEIRVKFPNEHESLIKILSGWDRRNDFKEALERMFDLNKLTKDTNSSVIEKTSQDIKPLLDKYSHIKLEAIYQVPGESYFRMILVAVGYASLLLSISFTNNSARIDKTLDQVKHVIFGPFLEDLSKLHEFKDLSKSLM